MSIDQATVAVRLLSNYNFQLDLTTKRIYMKLLNSADTAATLVELIDSHSNISFAVAWASTHNKVFEALKASQSKIRKSVIGTHFHQTDWRVLEWCLENDITIGFIFDTTANKVFHPKFYVMWSKDRWDVLIGSANLTMGGMNNNTELVLHLSSKSSLDDEFVQIARNTIGKYWNESEYVTRYRLNKYRKEFQEHKKKRSNMYKSTSSNNQVPELLQMDWPTFFAKVQSEDPSLHILNERLTLLRMARSTFEKCDSFSNLDYSDRSALAASVPSGRDDWEGIEIGGFGFTRAYGNFAHLIKANDPHVSRAISHIKITGKVYRSDYMNYVDELVRGFGEKPHGLGVVARLLTIKRPDVFVPFNGPIRKDLTKAFALKPALKPTDYERYWDEIIVRIIEDAPWYNANRPRKENEGEVWDGRVAMLDAFYYSPWS